MYGWPLLPTLSTILRQPLGLCLKQIWGLLGNLLWNRTAELGKLWKETTPQVTFTTFHTFIYVMGKKTHWYSTYVVGKKPESLKFLIYIDLSIVLRWYWLLLATLARTDLRLADLSSDQHSNWTKIYSRSYLAGHLIDIPPPRDIYFDFKIPVLFCRHHMVSASSRHVISRFCFRQGQIRCLNNQEKRFLINVVLIKLQDQLSVITILVYSFWVLNHFMLGTKKLPAWTHKNMS